MKHHHRREEGKQQHGSEVEERQSGEGVSRVFQFWIISRGTAIKKIITCCARDSLGDPTPQIPTLSDTLPLDH